MLTGQGGLREIFSITELFSSQVRFYEFRAFELIGDEITPSYLDRNTSKNMKEISFLNQCVPNTRTN